MHSTQTNIFIEVKCRNDRPINIWHLNQIFQHFNLAGTGSKNDKRTMLLRNGRTDTLRTT